MAMRLPPAADAALYEADFYLWVERRADLLRKGRFRDLDLAHLIEEVEDLAANLKSTVFSHTQQIIRHLLKLQFSAVREPRRLWPQTVRDQRDELELHLTNSLRAIRFKRRFQRGMPAPVAAPPRFWLNTRRRWSLCRRPCPYSLDQIPAHDWFPPNDRGVED